MDELKGQPTRRQILEDIERNPGSSAREIHRRLGLGWGETAYHLDRLTQGGAVRRERGGWRDFYFTSEITWEDRKILQALRSPVARRLLVAILTDPEISFGELFERSGVAKSTVSFHLGHLVQGRIVEQRWSEGSRRYRVVAADRVAGLLRVHRETLADRLVDRFVESFAGLLPE